MMSSLGPTVMSSAAGLWPCPFPDPALSLGSKAMAPPIYLTPPAPLGPAHFPRPRPHLCSLHSASSSSREVTRVTRPQATGSFGNPEVGGAWQESGGGASASFDGGGAVHRCPLPGPTLQAFTNCWHRPHEVHSQDITAMTSTAVMSPPRTSPP